MRETGEIATTASAWVPPHAIRVLHLFSNSKWTGPAEPALRLCLALRDKGVQADFACSPEAGSGFNKIVAVARDNALEPLAFMRLSKHRHPLKNLLDVRALRRRLEGTPWDLIHCHLDNDHDIALRAATAMGIPVIRSNHGGVGFPVDRRSRRLVGGSAAIIEPSRMARDADHAHFGVSLERLPVIPGAIDVSRFDPDRALPDMRGRLALPENAFVVGIVARMQTHRHYEDLFDAFARFVEVAPAAHLVVVGRGTRQDEVGFGPVRRLGLESRVHFPGYLDGDDFVGALAAFDAAVFLTPGSDGSCRAAREIMAMGKALVVADRGMLREIVAHEETGLVTDGSPGCLLDALVKLHKNPDLLINYGVNARKVACTHYSLTAQADAVLRLYQHILRA